VTEWRLFTAGQRPHVSTLEFHAPRERAPHVDQPGHRPRLLAAEQRIREINPATVVDLGCGDGGLLELLGRDPAIPAWGYDFAPANAAGWAERGVTAEARDVFNAHDVPRWGQLAVLTEVLEHLADPHGTLRWIAGHVRWVVASSPRWETGTSHAEEHAWAWDADGYGGLFDAAGWDVLHHEPCDWSQIVVAEVADP
jgi:hypothetical protein